MQILTFKLKPRQLFGAALAVTGLIVIVLTFVSNHNGKPVDAKTEISCATEEERKSYLSSLGYEFSEEPESKEIIIPESFNEVYGEYNEIQKKQGFDLEKYKGKKATLYTYKITNFKGNDNVIADLMVVNGSLVGADLCDPSAEDGFLRELGENGTS